MTWEVGGQPLNCGKRNLKDLQLQIEYSTILQTELIQPLKWIHTLLKVYSGKFDFFRALEDRLILWRIWSWC